MLFFFGTRATKVAQRQVKSNTTCPYCESQNSFVATTYGRYFHLFWIPIFPLLKSTILECSHCKKSYAEDELPEQVKTALQKENELNPARRPIWHSCGCLIIVGIIIFSILSSIVGYLFNKDEIDDTLNDDRRTQLYEDIRKATSNPSVETDSISSFIQTCIALSIDGIDTDKIGYYTKTNEDKLLLVMKVKDMKSIEKSSRKQLVFASEECLDAILYDEDFEYYIIVEGNWNTLMVKTPYDSDLGGKFADADLALPFYDTPLIIKSKGEDEDDVEQVIEIDSLE